MTSVELPIVSVIVPARNEEACLERCLESLVSQAGVPFEIIVVDDASTDQTGEIARSFAGSEAASRRGSKAGTLPPRGMIWGDHSGTAQGCAQGREQYPTVTVISAPPLAENWTGKNNAMSAGAKIAKGKWLLFTDADTFHKPGSLARAVAEGEREGAALLSYSPEQEVQTFSEKAVMPVIFAELAAKYPPAKVRDPKSPIAAANGQYLMISRDVYETVGGHAKIASDLLEDVALARLVKASGRKIWFRYGGDAVGTRMYRSWPQMKEGWTKNLATLFPQPVLYSVKLLGMWAFSLVTLGLAVNGLAAEHLGASIYLLPLLSLYARIACGRFGAVNSFLALAFGVPLAAYLLLRSALARRNGTITWKDRNYQTSAGDV
jgi:glycosyltransferase involved in cell wall biosynthesis